MTSCKKAKLSPPEPAEISQLPDEVLLRIFQHCSLVEKIKQLPLVCKRWRRLCRDKQLWKVIDIDEPNFFNRIIQKIVRTYGGKHTRVLRIHRSAETIKPANTKHTWEIIMQHCSHIEELYLEQLNADTFLEIYQMPDTLRKLYIINCCSTFRCQTNRLMSSLPNHKSLELINISGSHSIFRNSLNGISVLKTINKLKYISVKDIPSYTDTMKLDNIIPMCQLTHLEMRKYNNSKRDVPFKTILKGLQNLQKLNLSYCCLRSEESKTAKSGWTDMWDSTVPKLQLLELCGTKVSGSDETKYWFDLGLEDPFHDRPNLAVIGCKTTDCHGDFCTFPSIILFPTTFIPL